jgi:hypothetical protein
MKQFLSILILLCAFSGKAQYGVLTYTNNSRFFLVDYQLYKDSVLIKKDTSIFEFEDFYFDDFAYDSLIPGEYTLKLFLLKENYEIDDPSIKEIDINYTFIFDIKRDTLTSIDFDFYYSNYISYTPILESLYKDSTRHEEFLKSRVKIGPEYSIYFANRNWNPNSSESVSLIGGRMGGGPQMNFNRYFAGSIYGGIDIIYGLFNKSKTALSNSTQPVKHQNYIQSNLKFETAFHFQYPDKSYKKIYNPFAIKLGVGYNLPIVNRYTVFYTAGEISRNRFFHKFNDAYTFVGLNFHAFKISAEYHPFDLFKSGYYELSPFRVNIGFQILYDE